MLITLSRQNKIRVAKIKKYIFNIFHVYTIQSKILWRKKQLKFGIYNKEMLRNQSKQRIHRVSLQANQPPTILQSSAYTSKQNSSNNMVGLQKNRTFSHKKLSITSANTISTAVTNEQIRKVPIPTFQIHKFYKNPSKTHLLTQSKKTNFQDGKVSLKLGNQQNQNFDPISPNKSNSKIPIQINSNQNYNLDCLKNDLCQFINSKCQTLLFQVNNQSYTINELKLRIEKLQNQIKNKNNIISSLIQQRNYLGKTNFGFSFSQQQVYNRRLIDTQRTLQIIQSQSSKVQNSINQKLQHLTKQLVQLTLTSNSNNSVQRLRKCLNDSSKKLNFWLSQKQQKLCALQHNNFINVLDKIESAMANFRLISYKVLKLEQQFMKKEQSLRTEDTKTSIGYWQSFQDFIATGDEVQIQNYSSFAGDDYFFHPNNNSSIIKMKSSRHSSNFTVATLTNSDKQYSQVNKTTKLIEVASHLKLHYGDRLPLQCWIDKHNRIGVLESNKLLQNQKNKQYFKVTEEELKQLEDKRFITINKIK